MPYRPLLLGHRGARAVKSITENSLAAFDFAVSAGCDGFELDVRLTADGEAVLCHDETTRNLEISKSTARKLHLPLLKDVVERYQSTAFLDIELKVNGLEKITCALLRNSPPARGHVVSSFLPGVLESLRAIDRKMPLGLICESARQLSRFHDLQADYGIFHRRLVRQDLVQEMKADAKKLFVWTVNSAADMKRFARWGVDGIVSDDPRALSLTLNPEFRAGSRRGKA